MGNSAVENTGMREWHKGHKARSNLVLVFARLRALEGEMTSMLALMHILS